MIVSFVGARCNCAVAGSILNPVQGFYEPVVESAGFTGGYSYLALSGLMIGIVWASLPRDAIAR